MNSLDTNILIYAVNSACDEHEPARRIYEELQASPDAWMVSDQVIFEFYRALRNPKILERPLNHSEALKQIQFLREDSGALHCAYKTQFWPQVFAGLKESDVKSAHIFDRILAVTLLRNGVTRFFTRNTKDFSEFGFEEVINPIDA